MITVFCPSTWWRLRQARTTSKTKQAGDLDILAEARRPTLFLMSINFIIHNQLLIDLGGVLGGVVLADSHVIYEFEQFQQTSRSLFTHIPCRWYLVTIKLEYSTVTFPKNLINFSVCYRNIKGVMLQSVWTKMNHWERQSVKIGKGLSLSRNPDNPLKNDNKNHNVIKIYQWDSVIVIYAVIEEL